MNTPTPTQPVELSPTRLDDLTVDLHFIRDLILLALDATESPDMTERNRQEARAALVEALDLCEGGAA